MEAQKHKLIMHKKGEKDKSIYIQGQVRNLPMGIIEYVFPREDRDIVLTSLKFNLGDRRMPGWFQMKMLRKIAGCYPAPDFKKDRTYLWITEHVFIIPIGIKDDEDLVDDKEGAKGWTHEAI
jgi:hypothetical protein